VAVSFSGEIGGSHAAVLENQPQNSAAHPALGACFCLRHSVKRRLRIRRRYNALGPDGDGKMKQGILIGAVLSAVAAVAFAATGYCPLCLLFWQ